MAHKTAVACIALATAVSMMLWRYLGGEQSDDDEPEQGPILNEEHCQVGGHHTPLGGPVFDPGNDRSGRAGLGLP